MTSLKEAREALALSQADLAKRTGTTQSVISKLELGRRQLTARWAVKLAPVLTINPLEHLASEVRRVERRKRM